jgi:hypothetical protein
MFQTQEFDDVTSTAKELKKQRIAIPRQTDFIFEQVFAEKSFKMQYLSFDENS